MNNEEALGRWKASIGNHAQRQPHQAVPGPEGAPKAAGLASPAASTGGMEWGKKTVLLVDSNLRSRESRAKVMRTLGVSVDSVTNADTARVRLASNNYNLILVDLGHDIDGAESLVAEIRTRNSRQLVGFLVGSPLFVATSLSGHDPKRVPKAPIVMSVRKANSAAVTASDFGQKIRDAEADGEKTA